MVAVNSTIQRERERERAKKKKKSKIMAVYRN